MPDDMIVDVDPRIIYVNCKPGDKTGILTFAETNDEGMKLFECRISWDGIRTREIDAVRAITKVIRRRND